MLYKYKIQKIINGNNEIRYVIRYTHARYPDWFKWSWFWNTINDCNKTIKAAQDRISEELVKDKEIERERLAKQNKILEEYNYKMVPNHIPDEQIEKYLTIKGG